ncbi:riboflavin kinase [Blastococcus sp. SYSU D00820]
MERDRPGGPRPAAGPDHRVPTANVSCPPSAVLPDDGVYAGVARTLDGRPPVYRAAAISVGTNPTVDGAERTVEAHLLDFHGDLYGRRLYVRSVLRLRGMVRFPDIDTLVDAITQDVVDTRSVVAGSFPDALVPESDPLRLVP